MPRIVRFLLLHAGIGFALGTVFVGLLILTNAGGLRDLLQAQSSIIAWLALEIACGLTFASLSAAAAVMSLPYGKDEE